MNVQVKFLKDEEIGNRTHLEALISYPNYINCILTYVFYSFYIRKLDIYYQL